MPLSWNEIKSRALAFSKEWEHENSEDAEAKSFWDGFFHIFDIPRRRVATFEQQVKKVGGDAGYIDLLWKGTLLVEHKSRGRNLDKAYKQAKDYFPGLTDKELPRYILVSDFEKFRLYDLDTDTTHSFELKNLVDHVHLFGFIAGYRKSTYKEQDPVNIAAAELMGKLHDQLKAIGYEGHHLELYLVRLVFLLFADDTNIFNKGIFYDYIDNKTKEDGSDLAAHLQQLFEVLNTDIPKRLKFLDESLAEFPYVNGKLFAEHLPTAAFNASMRATLLECCGLDWGKISPAIFGSLFQSVMDEKARRNLGAHYTSEQNILKVIGPLFLDALKEELESVKSNLPKLDAFHKKIAGLRFLDPACGCGNFLIIAYRELRLLELEVIKEKLFRHMKLRAEVAADAQIDVDALLRCQVDRFYGIEYEEFPAQIAQVALWLMDHQMNMLVSNTFGKYYARLPLTRSAVIRHGNALRIDWQELIVPEEGEEGAKYDYILGNPPFLGKSMQNAEQKTDMESVFQGVNGAGNLDYVAAWYLKAAKYMHKHNTSSLNETQWTKTAFVSTNSISQGEQVAILWDEMFNKYGIKIHFAHRTFNWKNEAKGNAAVHVIVVGYSNFDVSEKRLFQYEDIKGTAHETSVKNISPYLVESGDIFVASRKKPISNAPAIVYGNKPVDGGHLFLTTQEKRELIAKEPAAKKYIKRIYGSEEYINNIDRWCLWLEDITPSELKQMPEILKRVNGVKSMRLESTKAATVKLASTPTLFAEIRQPKEDYLIIPLVSSERRKYIPIGLLPKSVIVNNLVSIVPGATKYHLGILASQMHMTWVKFVCGRMKSDFRYSGDIVYNNFPWPLSPTDKQVAAVESAAQGVLDARAQFPEASLADLYDPLTMPPVLVKAHAALDKAVDACYRSAAFPSETKRIEYLFGLYEQYTKAEAEAAPKKAKSAKKEKNPA